MRNAKIAFILAVIFTMAGCGNGKEDTRAEAPPPAQVVSGPNPALVAVDHPDQYPLATATPYVSAPSLAVTGTVNPDIARNVPVVTLASGRVVAIHARLGDTVQKNQVLLTVRSDDVSGGYSDYRKAVADETLAQKQLERSKDLFTHGAISQSDLDLAQDTEDKAKIDVETMAEHLRLLGNDPDRPNFLVDIKAPISGVITDQQVTNSAAVQAYGTNPFTISDMSSVWVVCDVYENDLPAVHLGDSAQITLNAYPGKVIQGRVDNIGEILDPSLRTAKVRIEVANPGGILRFGMFATATFHGQKRETYAQIPASAIMHLQDRDWVFEPAPGGKFQRVEVRGADMLPNNMQEILSGLQPGQRVVSDAIVLENAFENQ